VSAGGEGVSVPSTLSDVHDNNSVAFEGVHDGELHHGQGGDQDAGITETVRQVWNDMLDDLAGVKPTS
jgi:hypothetical protein